MTLEYEEKLCIVIGVCIFAFFKYAVDCYCRIEGKRKREQAAEEQLTSVRARRARRDRRSYPPAVFVHELTSRGRESVPYRARRESSFNDISMPSLEESVQRLLAERTLRMTNSASYPTLASPIIINVEHSPVVVDVENDPEDKPPPYSDFEPPDYHSLTKKPTINNNNNNPTNQSENSVPLLSSPPATPLRTSMV